MSLDGRASSGAGIDQEQLDQRLTKLIMDHNGYRTVLFRYIRRSLALCNWHIDQDYPSFFRQFDRTDKLATLVLYIRDHALQSFQVVDRIGTGLLNQVDMLLARAAMGVNGAGRGSMPFNNNRLLFLAGEVKEAIRFWREQCLCAQSMEPKVFELDRISEMRYLALTGEGSTIEEKTRALRISCEQARLITDDVEPFMDQWLGKLSVVERPKDEPAHGNLQGYGSSHTGSGLVGASAGSSPANGHMHPGMSLDYRSLSSQSLGSPRPYSSQSWGQGAS
ncbi:hypothetical protein EDD11_003019 [Mortierella claussenii]|nr:hypothetical protein EDD11_003019 [Mortierella claussenii]